MHNAASDGLTLYCDIVLLMSFLRLPKFASVICQFKVLCSEKRTYRIPTQSSIVVALAAVLREADMLFIFLRMPL